MRIRNLSIQGITTGSTGILGATMGALYVENVVITGFNAGNGAGIRFQPTNASAKLFVAVQGGMVATNDGDGIRAVAATAVLNLTITGTSIVNNFGIGVLASGGVATVRIGGATISGNTTGVSFAGATMQSFKNNQIAGNVTDGTPIPSFSGPDGAALQ